MGFNYASEKRRFDAEWDALAKLYREAGMSEAAIQAMREFDWDWFKQRRTYENRYQVLPSEVIDDSDNGSNSTLFKKLPSLSSSFDETAFTSRYAWIDTIDNPVLSDKLYRLSDDDKELLTLYIMEGLTLDEIASLRSCSHQAISKQIKKVKNFLK